VQAPLRILLADDAADNRILVAHHLKDHLVDAVTDGAAAVARATSAPYDAILMDMNMPGMDGLTAVTLIREWEQKHARQPTPIIALTAHAHRSAVRASLAAGCTAHLSKPFRKAELLRILMACGAAGCARLAPEPCAGGAPSRLPHIPDELRALVPGFLQRVHADIATLRRALVCGQFEEITRLGHMLKGSGGSYGFDEITAIGARLERLAAAQDHAGIAREIDALAQYLSQVRMPDDCST